MNRRQQLVLLGLLSAVAFLMVILVIGYNREGALAQEGPRVGPPPMLAATGACGIGAEVGVLYLIDTEKRQLAVYSAFGGRALEFVAARKILYDLELIEANDDSPTQYRVRTLKRFFDEYKKGQDDSGDGPPRRR